MPYQGISVPIYISSVGLYGGKNLENAPPNSLIVANNVEFSGRSLRKESGTAKYNPNTIGATTIILGGIDWRPSGSSQSQVVFTSSGAILSDKGTASFTVTAAAGLTATGVIPQFVAAGKEEAANSGKLFLFTGVNAPYVMVGDATAMAAVTQPAADWSGGNQPKFGVVHENRLWAGGNLNDPSRIYYSAPSGHDRFATALSGTISVYPGDGGKLVGGISFKGFLILFKNPRGIYAVDTSDSDTTKWRVKKITGQVGAINPNSIVQVIDDVLFVDRSGSINALSATQEFGDVKSSAISDFNAITEYIRQEINRGGLSSVQCEYYQDRREVHIAMPAIGQTTNNRRLVIDLNEFPNMKFRVSSRDTVYSFWTKIGSDNVEKLVYGSNDGFVRVMDQDSFTHDSDGYDGRAETIPTNFAHIDPEFANIGKIGDFLDITAETLGDFPFNVDVLWDGAVKHTMSVNPASGAAVLGSFVLGTDKLTAKTWRTIRKRITGSGQRFSTIIRQSADANGFSISDMRLLFRPGEIRSKL